MTTKLCVFVSSVQKELEDERLIVQNLVNTDAFLSAYCTPVLYEMEPASPDKALEGCLRKAKVEGLMAYGIRKLIVNRSAVIVKRGGIKESHDNHTMTHRNHPISSPAEVPGNHPIFIRCAGIIIRNA